MTGFSATRSGGDSLWQTLLRWMPGEADPWGANPATPPCESLKLSHVPSIRAAFETCLRDLQGEGVDTLKRSIRCSRSLRDLWHLRAQAYTEVARAFSQTEAEARLKQLNAHFQFGSSLSLSDRKGSVVALSHTGRAGRGH
ncbi:hypothetical protein WG899_02625 [Paucibacter sp. AS339]|uniref:hypothetical protein n=1 Tax=Paucibacter hankyongi TaxID=3133434 RepID=UPI0030AF7DBA